MSVLTLENVSKRIGSRTIVEGISMNVNEGEIYGFLGENGAGKTTTIRMIVGLISMNRGRISICGNDINRNRKQALQYVGAIVENPETYGYLSGRKNLIHYARLAGISNRNRRIEEVTEIVGLKDRINDKVKTYSLGMKQRLGVAQALLGNPKLLILDEPTNGLDPSGIKEFRELMQRLAASGMSVFVSSHILAEVEQLCDRVGIIKNGRMVTEQNVGALVSNAKNAVLLRVNPIHTALQVFANHQFTAVEVVDQQTLRIEIEQSELQQVMQLLMANQVSILSVEQVKASLEDEFFKLTKGGI